MRITNRGSRKDFVDMAFLLREHTLTEILGCFMEKIQNVNPALAVRSLSYFEDAAIQPMPKMLVDFDWEEEKDKIRLAVKSFFS